jgi:hypothetical protein
MKDLELAKQLLKTDDLSLVIVKNKKIIFQTRMHGIKGFLQTIERFEDDLVDASLADKIVGRAIAMLCIYSKIKAVYAVVISEEAMSLLKNERIYCEAESLVPYILGKDKMTMCPFEKAVINVDKPYEAYERLRNCVEC